MLLNIAVQKRLIVLFKKKNLGYTDLRLWCSQFEFLEIIVENDISLGYISKENGIPDYIMCKKNGTF